MTQNLLREGMETMSEITTRPVIERDAEYISPPWKSSLFLL